MIVKLSNSLGYQVSVSSINVTTSSGVSVTQPESATLNPGQTQEFIVFGICPKTSGSSFSDTITVAYTEPSNPIPGPYSLSGTAKGTSTTPTYNTFTAYGLPGNVPWTVEYAGMNQTTTSQSMQFVSFPGSSFQVYPVSVNGVTYYPVYAAGFNLPQNYNLEDDFISGKTTFYLGEVGGTNATVFYPGNLSFGTNIDLGAGAVGIALTPNGEYAYMAENTAPRIGVISTSTNQLIKNISLLYIPSSIAISPDGEYAYVTSGANNTVAIISIPTNQVIKYIPVGSSPRDVAITPNGQYVYVTNFNSNTTQVISTATNSVVKTIFGFFYPSGIAIALDGLVYVSNAATYKYDIPANYTISVINSSNNEIVADIPVYSSISPRGLAISPDGKYLYVTDGSGGNMSVISLKTYSVVATIPIPYAKRLVFSPNGEFLYVTTPFASKYQLHVISTSNDNYINITSSVYPPFANLCPINDGPLGNGAGC
jgi:YVTN family beta-propeller protein